MLTGLSALASTTGAVLLAGLGPHLLARLVPALVNFNTGVLLGAACLDLLPPAFFGAVPGEGVDMGLPLRRTCWGSLHWKS